MNKSTNEIFSAFKEGQLSLVEVKQMLQDIRDVSPYHPLSEGQKGLWTLQKIFPDMTAYNVPLCFRVLDLEVETFKKACQFLVKQYPILNTVIKDEDGTPYQTISPAQELVFQQEDLSNLASDQLIAYLNQKAKQAFILKDDPLLRIHLFSVAGQETVVLINIHHMIFDGISVLILMKTLFDAYHTLLAGNTPRLLALLATYADFVTAEQQMLQGKEGASRLVYWQTQLAEPLPQLSFPTDRPRSVSQNPFQGKTISTLLSSELSEQIRQFSKAQQSYMSTVFLGLFKLLLCKYTDQRDVIVGMPVNQRHAARFQQMIGFLINMVPIRSELSSQDSFLEFLGKLQKTMVNSMARSYPFSALVRALNLSAEAQSAPLFQVAFEYQDFFQELGSQAPAFQFVEGIHQEGEYELVLEVMEQKDGFGLNWKYNPELFDEATIARMMAHYTRLIEAVLKQPNELLDGYSLLSKTEQKTLLEDWNETQADYPRDKCVHELFAEQAKQRPQAIAVVYQEQSLTYQALDKKSSVLARHLQNQGLKANQLVAICVPRSLDMLVGLLGILKAGGAYVPLDPEYPSERLAYILKDSQAKLILTHSQVKEKVFSLLDAESQATGLASQAAVIILDEPWSDIKKAAAKKQKPQPQQKKVRSGDLAYVIYTSGSTGDPKGVMVAHQALTNFLISMSHQPGLQSQDKLLAVTTYCFDIAGLELYLPLIKGAQCHLCDTGTSHDAEKLKSLIAQIKPSIMQATPSTWAMLFHAGWQNQEKVRILCGGEALPESLRQHFVRTDSEAWNLFGPTETTIWSTIERLAEDRPISIGKPIANTQIYILDQQNQLIPMGLPGELCIGGDGLAQGYFNQGDLTAEKFIDNPFNPDSKLYRTGDLARWNTDGTIEHLGRLDFQVKIHGFRIELGEIENQLNRHPAIKTSTVIVKQQADSKQLVAYYVPNQKEEGKASRHAEILNVYLKEKLPDYMIPTFLIALDQMPLTPNGKMDRKALMSRPLVLSKNIPNSLPPLATEKEVLALWQELLQVEGIGATDGFFDVGGDSVSAVILAARINKKFAVSFTATQLFQHANVRKISQYLHQMCPVAVPAKVNRAAPLKEPVPSPAASNRTDVQQTYPDYYQESLAIIGLSCHFPGANDHREFWQNLRRGKESARFLSEEALREANVPEAMIQNPSYVPMRNTIEGKDLFDPEFFNLSPKNAAFMDPQFRQLLLHAWQAIEDAGYVSKEIPQTSVFMSASSSYYQTLLHNSAKVQESDEYQAWLLSQGGTIPTMISYELGLTGPSVFIHSNCSSSLVALSSAYQSLQLDQAQYALIGASTLFPAAKVGYVYQPGLNFASDGHCKTFDASADGMIAGEGAGAILVKKALHAIADGDHIYGLLRGVALNNDGADKAGFYAPSVNGQAEVIQKVLASTGVDPASISYVEAHGTGTKLGDPIEVLALTQAYQKHTTKNQFCALGSVKSNIGHLDTAAGLAGCIKVVLSLKHQQIPPSINYKSPNPEIDFARSPFYVVDHLQPWPQESLPRRAAVSAFGIGGTNAHAILEAFPVPESPVPESIASKPVEQASYLLPLSAKNPDRLAAYVEKLLAFVKASQDPLDLREVCYTLQVGRTAMASRVIFIVTSVAELIENLAAFTLKQAKPGAWFQGEFKQTNDAIEFFEQDEDARALVDKWFKKGKLTPLAELWVKGGYVNWHRLYSGSRPQRMSLPTYPFAQERYGVEEDTTTWQGMEQLPEKLKGQGRVNNRSELHPLVQQNTSDLLEQRFSSRFTGKEFFFADHIIAQQKVLPGVAFLEMARAAVAQATSALYEGATEMHLKQVVWQRPIVLNSPVQDVHISLSPADPRGSELQCLAYEIYGQSDDGQQASRTLYGQGFAILLPLSPVPSLDLATLRQDIIAAGVHYSAEKIYAGQSASSFLHGPGFRAVEEIHIANNRDHQPQVLAKLQLPASVAATQADYTLHPSLMDAAIQAALFYATRAAVESGNADGSYPVPYALQNLRIYEACSASMWAWIRYADGHAQQDKIEKLDIDLCNEQGKVCARMEGFSYRFLAGHLLAGNVSSTQAAATLMLKPCWQEQRLVAAADAHAIKKINYLRHVVILCEADTPTVKSIEALMDGVSCVYLQSPDDAIEKRFQAYVIEVFELIRSMVEDKPNGNCLIQVLVPSQGQKRLLCGIASLLQTAHLEHAKIHGQVIEMDAGTGTEQIVARLKENSQCPTDIHICYQGDTRQVKGWEEIQASDRPSVGLFSAEATVNTPWREQGIYLITGGMGALGRIFAKEIAHQVNHTTLILTGRSRLNEAQQAQLSALQALGGKVEYRQVDISAKQQTKHLIDSIQKEYGALHGIIHCAGISRDNYIFKKTITEIQDVFAAKVKGTVNLDQATQAIRLDCFVLFSSVSAMGSIGQADYATANAFMDAYAHYRSELVACQQRYGQTLSINWPLWQKGGMGVDAATSEMMKQRMDRVPMETSMGIDAFYQALSSGSAQVMVESGDIARLRQKWFANLGANQPKKLSKQLAVKNVLPVKSVQAKMKKSVIDESELLEKIHRALVYRVAKLLEVKVEDIHGESAFEKFGFDSISFTDFCNQLNKQYQLEMMPTIFFEYPTLNAFAHYLAGEHQTQLAEYFQLHTSPVASAETFVESLSDQEESTETAVMEAPFVTRPLRLLANNTQRSTTPLASPAPADGIAIIGMSGKFPMAEDIASLWDNLIAGQDCISEIPADRWDWRSCYGDPLEGDNQTKIKWGGFIDGIREFDPLFFGISPREAEWMDPQQRLLMTYIWHAIEDAGYSAGSLAGKNIGIFVATDGSSGYAGLIERAGLAQDNASVTGLVPSMGPSRMSYFLNIHGPSEPIETACSSSLVAIHRAVQAMASGSCEMAIVGGINIILTPKAHIGFSLIGALSAEGRCKAFSSQANGFALSEGVGMLVLKKLPQAQNSGDHIYGVIRGTAENHGGRASSFTAPNPVAQAELLKAAYRQAGIDPRSVSYIETHGTGTKLGDPTEINGLKAAFQDLYRGTGNSSAQAPHCGLGSIKTNIGHTVLAAGVASVIKVLLQLKHKTLVKTLHCEQINPYIQLKDSPFYIVQKQQAWHCLQDTQGHDLPRRAGVSSFGMGGVNAHVVIEEYRAESSSVASARLPDKQLLGKTGSQLIVLSAKNDERLKEAVNNLYRYLTEHVSLLADDLQSIAYTLQTGREAMDERLGLMVKSTEELQEKLQAFLDGEENNETLYRGQVKRNKDTLAVFTADGDLQKAMDAWISKGKYNKLLDFWVKGLIFDWDKLYGEDKPRRISLPTYPFAKQQYWVPEGKGLKTEHKAITRSILHPLVHENTSSLSEQRFSSTFTGEEFFLKDHKVQGEKVLPGVAYLEMARAAMVQAAEGTSAQLNPDRQQLQLSNVVWVRPIRVNGEAQRVHISLFPEANNTVAYEVYIEDTSLDVDDAVVVHSQGIASFLAENQSLAALDLAQLQSRMTQETLTAEQCYETFKAMGLEYGVAHQGIEEIAIGQQEALAKLSLPASVAAGFEQYTLHPSLLDAALQASIGLADQSNSKAALPFALENLEILSPCTSTMWAWVRYAKGSSASDKIQKLDIDLCDDDGRICVRLKSFCSRVLESNVLSSSPGEVGTLMLKPVWQEKAVEKLTKLTHYAGHRVFLCGFSSLHQALEKHLPQVVLIDLESAATDLASRFNDAALQLFGILQQLVKEKPKEPVLIQVLVSNEGSEQVYASLSSLLKTAQLENPKIVGQVIVVEANASVDTVSQRLEENSCSPQETQVRYEQNTRLVASFEECIPPQKRPDNPWKASGVYLITGGAGGLGLIFSQAIAEQAEKPTLILTGRSALDNDKQEKLETLRALGANVAYQQVDVTDKQVVHSLIQTIQQDYGPLNGVLHSAGVNNDNFILKKTPAEFARVLAPKVAGTVNLDEASQAIDLDFFVLFSSLAGSFGNVGQADYATANGFMDAYAHYRNDLVATQQRYGQSLSINWPLWKEGGMGVDATAEQLMKTATGMVAMQSAKGINALVQSLSSSVSQVLVMVGQLKRMKQHLLSGTEKPLPSTQPPTPAQARTVIDTDTLFSKLQNVLLQKAAELLKIRVEDLDADTELNEYGFDSISLTEFINQLNQRYQLTLAPTIFFEYPTIETFAHYLSESHQAVFTNEFNLQGQDQQRIEREDVKDKKQHLSSGTEKSLPSTQPPTPVQVRTVIDTDTLFGKLQNVLLQKAAELLKIRVEDLDTDTELNEYGFDSISLTEFINQLNQRYQLTLAPTIFFEYPTIETFAHYLSESHQAVFANEFNLQGQDQQRIEREDVKDKDWVVEHKPRHRFAKASILPSLSTKKSEAIAIIGMSGKFPQADNLEIFWQNLQAGKDCISEIPPSRWNWQSLYGDPYTEVNKTNIKWGGFIDGVDEFDPLFFGISPREAQLIDPQQRLLMAYVWQVIEDAGYSAESLSGTQTGIFIGTGSSGYSSLISQADIPIEGYSATGMVPSVGPNRMSYLLNLHGPSEPIETACSSSLVAIHRAVQTIEAGDCEMAIVGGINIIITPQAHISFNKAGMLCEDGRCKTFSDKANGYVRGEGVGMLFLKKLSIAEQDRDHIYGVIRGSAENHGGRANSLTAPNPKAQADLLQTAYKKAGIDPRTVSYIETHGTGTALGDPIEINGLKSAFDALYKQTGDTNITQAHCGLGSVKSNIGHLELAAGVAGVIKVLLQLKHCIRVKSLHCDKINPYIELKDSPFYIVQENQDWPALKDAQGQTLPRRAGVSSFGFGGVNAHVVIEEYCPQPSHESDLTKDRGTVPPFIMVLSGKNQERLQVYAQKLLNFIQNDDAIDLANIAYTLQVGRKAMEERLGLIVNTQEELQEKLQVFLDGKESIEDLYRGQVKRNKDALAVFSADEDMAKIIDIWINKGKYHKLLDLWVKGLIFDWNKLYGEHKPRRISLPTYPFAKERYWVEVKADEGLAQHVGIKNQLHPLLHANTSTLSQQRFSSVFTGEEFFLEGHQVNGQKVLPAVVYLEMVQAAITHAVEASTAHSNSSPTQQHLQLSNVVWARPITVSGQRQDVHIGLFPEANNTIAYEVYTQGDGPDALVIVHSQGVANFIPAPDPPLSAGLDLPALRARMNQGSLSAEQCYQTFKRIGIEYGLAHQGIEQITIGEQEALAKLSLPTSVAAGFEQYTLHPSLLDAVLQASIGLADQSNIKAPLPFALESLEVLSPCTSTMWAWLRYAKGSLEADKLQTLDIDLCNDQGKICVRMKGLEIPQSIVSTSKDFSSSQKTLAVRQSVNPDDSNANILTKLISSISEITKIPNNKIDEEADLEELGLDSIMIATLNNKLEEWLGKLDATLFFKYKTISSLAKYLSATYSESIAGEQEKTADLAKDSNIIKTQQIQLPSFTQLRVRERVAYRRNKFSNQDIAIIGMSGRYPQANNLDEFWKNLRMGRDCITEIPQERFDYRPIFSAEKGKMDSIYCKWGGFIDDIDQFDAPFFNILPLEAAFMDPQERIFLETVWQCLEIAGYINPYWQREARNIGVFAGVTFNNYQLLAAEAAEDISRTVVNSQTFSIANRVSYLFNFTGPSFCLDTACSSSLFAVHQACESLKRGECHVAVAGGVNLSLHSSKYITLCVTGFASSDGRCHAFTAGGDGYVPSEGVGVVLLKPLHQAKEDEDSILAVIKGSGVSHDGKTQGYTVPNPVSQSKAIEAAFEQANISPASISYFEAHGTGTALGDPIEIQGLTDVYSKHTEKKQYCAMGSVKSNIGHGEAAAGIAQLSKTVLQLQHKTLVPSVLHGPLNPNIDFKSTPFFVQEKESPWLKMELDGHSLPRRAGISSFGAGGVNVHLIVEEAPEIPEALEPISAAEFSTVIPLSAHLSSQLPELARNLRIYCEQSATEGDQLQDIAYTLQTKRALLRYRLAFVVRNKADLLQQLVQYEVRTENDGSKNYYEEDTLKLKDSFRFTHSVKDQQYLKYLLQQEKMDKLAQLWVSGTDIPWAQASMVQKPSQCLPLPTYPFLKKRHWVSEQVDPKKPIQITKESFPEDDLNSWMLKTQWQEKALRIDNADAKDQLEPVKNILLIADDKDLLSKLNFTQASVTKCLISSRKTNSTQADFILDKKTLDYSLLLKNLNIDSIDCIILAQSYLDIETLSYKAIDKHFAGYARKVNQLVQFVRQQLLGKDIKIVLLNCSDGNEPNVFRQIMSKYFSFLRYEYFELQSSIIHLQVPPSQTVLERIYLEINHVSSETEVQIHSTQRFVQRLQPLTQTSSEAAQLQNKSSEKLNISGCMILTGAFGGIGFTLLNWLITKGVREIVAIGRKPITASFTHPNHEAATTIQSFIEKQAATGVKIHYLQADTGQAQALETAFKSLRKQIQLPVIGVFHLAGVTTDAIPLDKMDEEKLLNVVSPKLYGAYGLHKITRHDPIEYFCLFSSISAVEGMQGNGLSAYASANASLNALGELRKQQNKPVQLIQWTDWDEAGMAVAHDHAAFFAAVGMMMLSPQLGLAALEKILTQSIPSSVVFNVDWGKYSRVNPMIRRMPFFSDYVQMMDKRESSTDKGIASQANEENMPQESLGQSATFSSTQYSEFTQASLKDYMLNQLALLLGNEDLSTDENFNDLGLDSVNSLSFFTTLSADLSLEISPSLIFRYPNISTLAQYLFETMLKENATQQSVENGKDDSDKDYDPTSELEAAILEAEEYL